MQRAVIFRKLYKRLQDDLACKRHGAYELQPWSKTVYFATLDQYKYNPALVISGAEGDQVLCGAPGIIKSIDVTAQTRNNRDPVDLGNGYEVLYGQLKEVPVKVGDQVEAKSILGYIGQPTKYYSVEGATYIWNYEKMEHQ